jgi:hypothetical protein
LHETSWPVTIWIADFHLTRGFGARRLALEWRDWKAVGDHALRRCIRPGTSLGAAAFDPASRAGHRLA